MTSVTLRVANIANDLSRKDLATVFSSYGNVQRLYVSGQSAVVQFRENKSAAKALCALQGCDWDVQWEPRRARKRAPSRWSRTANA